MFQAIILQIKRKVPIVSLLLIFSCLISTLPQFFLGENYSYITGQKATLKSFYLFTLSSFTHSPQILFNHLIGNLLVFIFFGIVTEIIIGSRRFALISLITFLATTTINYLHSTNNYLGHGASGIIWGYHIFFLYILIILFEYLGKEIFKDRYILIAIFLCLFDIIGIPILEVFIMEKGFFANFGQTLHLVSMVVVVPFVLMWRKEIEENVKMLISQKPMGNPITNKRMAIIIILLLVVLNGLGTYKIIDLLNDKESMILYEVKPEKGSPIEDIPQKILVEFDKDIIDWKRTMTSIYYDDSLGEIKLTENWINPKTIEITFNRKFTNSDRIKLVYSITSKLKNDILINDNLTIEY